MLKKLRTFVMALLLTPMLAMNASAYMADFDKATLEPPQQNMCWVYFAGRWWLLPC